jgi:hypothetical protein
MRRLKDYFRIIAWQTGLGYLLLWAVTFWTLDEGASVFGKSGVCYPDEAKVLFYWVCDAASPLAILAAIANVALTATVWAPVYLAAATVQPDAAAIAAPIVVLHLVGLPLAIFVLVRLLAAALDLRRRIGAGRASTPPLDAAAAGQVLAAPAAAAPALARPRPSPPPKIKPRTGFGLRGADDGRPKSDD